MPRNINKLSPLHDDLDNDVFKSIISNTPPIYPAKSRKYEIGYLNFKDISNIEFKITYVLYLLLINKNKRLNLLKDTIPQDIHENCINLAIYQDKLTSNKYLFKLTKYTENINASLV